MLGGEGEAMAGRGKRDWEGSLQKQFRRHLDQGHPITAIASIMKTTTATLRRHYADLIKAAKSGTLADTWTTQDRHAVQMMTGFGLTNEEAAIVMGISEDSLKASFHEELKLGGPLATLAVAGSLFRAAVDRGDVQAMKFWLARRSGWIEEKFIRGQIDHTIKPGDQDQEAVDQLRQMSPATREKLEEVLATLGAESTLGDRFGDDPEVPKIIH